MAFVPNTQPLQRDSSKLTGRLIAFPTSQGASVSNARLSSAFSIEFPSMPDSIEFARRAEYIVQTSPVLPDGVHAYKRTEPLKIPFSFRLHYNDKAYCPNGALSILQIAARLHTFLLPINLSGGSAVASVKANQPNQSGDDASVQQKAQSATEVKIDQKSLDRIYPPLTARLELIFSESNQVGVSCNGYVDDVNVKLNGPFLRGPNNSFNLPTSADFSFVFVHRPGHGNGRDFLRGISLQSDAYAADVRDRFYNTADMVIAANYQGFEPATTTVSPDAPVNPAFAPTSSLRPVTPGTFDQNNGTWVIPFTQSNKNNVAPPLLLPQDKH